MLKKLKDLSYKIPAVILAADTGDGLDRVPKLPIYETANVEPQQLVVRLINYALFFLGALALVFVIYGGVLYITSGGDADKTKKARDTLLYAIIGVIVIVLSYAIVNWASHLFAPGSRI